ncbi:putative T7SS-secreted protein [Nocardia sp. NPDC020380]|uniref:putative T7SS-secreted protein n=1 Tax=Nocardia sp. NPDC020380 TaxID=3364309 RepID=UPI00379D668A
MGLGDFLDNIGDKIENAVDSAVDTVKKKAGEAGEGALDGAAVIARGLGADGVADDLNKAGEHLADLAGADVPEKELGETDDPKELIHGDPSAIHTLAGKLRTMGDDLSSTGEALKSINVADWTGRAADAFHHEYAKQPKLWWDGSDAMHAAAGLLDSWYWTVTTAQTAAEEAIREWQDAAKEEKRAKDSYNALSSEQKKRTTLTDSWSSMRQNARDRLREARKTRDQEAASLVSGIDAEKGKAPEKPPFHERMLDDLGDIYSGSQLATANFTKGLLTSATSMVQFIRSTDILDPYNLTHPAEYFEHMGDLGTGLITAAADPGSVVKSYLKHWSDNPSEAAGSFVGDILLTVATDGTGTVAKTSLTAAKDSTLALDATRGLPNVLDHGLPDVPVGRGIPHDAPAGPAVPTRDVAPAPQPVGGPETKAPVDVRPGATEPGGTAPHPDGGPAHLEPDATRADPAASNPHPDAPPVDSGPRAGLPDSSGPHVDSPGGPMDSGLHQAPVDSGPREVPVDSGPKPDVPGTVQPAHPDLPAPHTDPAAHVPDAAPANVHPNVESPATPNLLGSGDAPRAHAPGPHVPDSAGPHPDSLPGARPEPIAPRADSPAPVNASPRLHDAPPSVQSPPVRPDAPLTSPAPRLEGPVSHPSPPGDLPRGDAPRITRDPLVDGGPVAAGPRAADPVPNPSKPHPDSPMDHRGPREQPPVPDRAGGPSADPGHPKADAPHPDSPADAHPNGPHSEPVDPHPHTEDPNFGDRAHADTDGHPHQSATDTAPETNRTPNNTCAGRDPVDIATGEFLLPETDLELPGVLALVLRRRHRSNYRFGRWFGPSWSATLDVRVVVEDAGVTLLAEDGLMLAYPHPEPGVAVEAISGGPGWTLTRTDVGGYRVWDPQRELLWHFAPNADLDGLDTQLGNYAISAITDRHHNRIRFHYNTDGEPVAVTHSGGYRVDIETAAGRITTLTVVGTDELGSETRTQVRKFGYQSGNLTSVTNAVSATTHYTYDDHARMLSWTDSKATSLHNTYDEVGRVTHQQGTDNILNSTFDYLTFPDGTGTLTTVTDSLGAATYHGFDHDLRLRDLTDPAGGRTHYDYNQDRHPLKVVAPDGATTEYRYTTHGDVAQVIRPDGASITVDYQRHHRPTTITDVDGGVRRREWDEPGNLIAETDEAGVRTEYTHHRNGAVSSVLAATGARTTIEVDAAGLPITVVDPYGATTHITRDTFGRPIQVTDPLGAVTRYEWSPAGNLLSRTDPDGHIESWTWDGEGNQLTHTDRAGGLTYNTYGTFDLLESQTAPDGSVTRYTWDTERRLTAVTNPLDQTWTYAYDAAGRLIAETEYTGATTHYTHDRAGRVATVTPATGVTRHHNHDVLGRLIEIVADTGEWRRYLHDRQGRVLTAVSGIGEDPIHTLEFGYTPTGQLRTQQLDDQPPLRHEYDAYGRRIRRTSPGAAVTTWHWDIANRVQSMSTDGRHIHFTHDHIGRQTGWRLGELAVDRTLSATNRVTTQQVTGFPASSLNLDPSHTERPEPRSLRHDTYSYRPDGYLTAHTLERHALAPEHRQYCVDPIGRVTTITRDDVLAESYAYDPLSNITDALSDPVGSGGIGASGGITPLELPNNAGVQSDLPSNGRREYRNNLLIRDGRTRYHYDHAGRLTRKTTHRLSRKPDIWHYHYDAFNQLTALQTPDGQRWHYTYDAVGRRSAKQRRTDGGAVLDRTDYTWDTTYLIEQATAQETTRWHYQPTSRAPITQTTDQGAVDRAFYAIITDLVGTPTDLVDPDTAQTVATATTNLWGGSSWHGSADTPLRFPGQIHDPETGLHYNLHRVYDPETGRFLTQDFLGLAPAPNPNTYPKNPLVWTDPLGLTPCPGSDIGGTGGAEVTRVGRWMNPEEHQKMVDTGFVQEGGGGTTYVANPADPAAFRRQAPPGSVYVEFDVPTSSISPAGEPGWGQIRGPNHWMSQRLATMGRPVPEMPRAHNLSLMETK